MKLTVINQSFIGRRLKLWILILRFICCFTARNKWYRNKPRAEKGGFQGSLTIKESIPISNRFKSTVLRDEWGMRQPFSIIETVSFCRWKSIYMCFLGLAEKKSHFIAPYAPVFLKWCLHDNLMKSSLASCWSNSWLRPISETSTWNHVLQKKA